MLDSHHSPSQGLNELHLRLDCHSRPVAASQPVTDPVTPGHIGSASPTLSQGEAETPLSSSSSYSNLYTLSSTINTYQGPVLAPPTSPPTSPRRQSFHVEAGSPKIRSPLRNSISLSDGPKGLQIPSSALVSTPRSRVGHTRFRSVDMALTGDKRTSGPRASEPVALNSSFASTPGTDNGPLTRWFSRANTGSESSMASSSTWTPPNRACSASTTPKLGSSAGSSRFAFFTSSVPPKDTLNSTVPLPEDDEITNLDIETTLFPNGPPGGTAFSPAAFKNLQMNATGLANKLQTAYQKRTMQYQELRAEREAQDEEKDEMEIRVQHLKMQLEDMARKASEREEVMASLLQELALERRSRSEEQVAREKGVTPSGASMLSEDLCVDEDRQKRNWRKSNATSKSDLSLDTDEESTDEASIFSRSRSPTINTSMSETSPVPTPTQQKPTISEPPRANRTNNSQISTLQKLWKGYTESSKEDDSSTGTSICCNCQGQNASVAWDTVTILKDENKGLKTRVEELESAVESALDAVNGIAL